MGVLVLPVDGHAVAFGRPFEGHAVESGVILWCEKNAVEDLLPFQDTTTILVDERVAAIGRKLAPGQPPHSGFLAELDRGGCAIRRGLIGTSGARRVLHADAFVRIGKVVQRFEGRRPLEPLFFMQDEPVDDLPAGMKSLEALSIEILLDRKHLL